MTGLPDGATVGEWYWVRKKSCTWGIPPWKPMLIDMISIRTAFLAHGQEWWRPTHIATNYYFGPRIDPPSSEGE